MLLDGESLDERGGMTAYVPIPVAQVMWSSHIDQYDRLAMKATLNLNDQILRQAKRRAAQDGVTLTRFVEEALRAKLAAARGRKPAFKLKLKTVVSVPSGRGRADIEFII